MHFALAAAWANYTVCRPPEVAQLLGTRVRINIDKITGLDGEWHAYDSKISSV